ncbi:hypothetical protein DO97_16300 [Neosynechococcus sphagnicola sy1]|uniref:Uncharacterized protein n=1 Tax=Neosynechococcus sphagnicola sy1 TaxID=1497020 RepID=A0A098TI69_9CYAN|nr:hypothetical protein [Neosynechococcus sphagnicola]KGF71677.1 hypothetical protein DO97_16300 [Neosynechococcus sphagnicola sy1]
MIVLVAVQDVGGANALTPVIHQLRARQVEVVTLACGKALSVVQSAGIPHQALSLSELAESRMRSDLSQLLTTINPDILLLGTAWGLSLDKEILAVNQTCDRPRPTVSLIDMWSNYRTRFTHPLSGELVLPTQIALMDAIAYEQAIAEGLPLTHLIVTGQPYLEQLPLLLQKASVVDQAAALRKTWLSESPTNSSIVLFASEAFSRDFPPHSPYYRGYTEITALQGLIQAVELEEQRSHRPWVIVDKLHPEESLAFVRAALSASQRQIHILEHQPPLPCILAADLIVGMTSMFLVESAFCGQPTLSFQPDTLNPQDFIGSRIGVVPAATSIAALSTWLSRQQIACQRQKPSGSPTDLPSFQHRGATTRVIDVLLKLIHSA